MPSPASSPTSSAAPTSSSTPCVRAWVKTDMGGPNATVPVEKGADTAAWLATLPDGGPTGGFFRDRRLISW